MPKRSYSTASGYRYGFNGKENDNDVKGLGNQQDYGMRIYDARIGKFLSVDPLTDRFVMLTPYQFATNSPIWAIDLDGKEGMKSTFGPIISTAFLKRGSDEALILKLKHPTWSDFRLTMKATWNVTRGMAHDVLDVAGLLPAAGEPLDLINGVLYTLEGDKSNAVVSFAGTIPIAGSFGTGLRWAKKALRLSDNAFHSASGLVFKIGSKHGNRLAHVVEHTADDLSKDYHGVFQLGDKLVENLDDAYSKAKSINWNSKLEVGQSETIGGITRTLRKEKSGIISENFIVDMGHKVGFEGGKKGTGEALNKIQISVQQGTSDVLAAFPTKN